LRLRYYCVLHPHPIFRPDLRLSDLLT
jgi:hypothetical protein